MTIPEQAVEQIKWRRVNGEPFEYAIQQGPHGDEFVKLIDGSCLRRPFMGVERAALPPLRAREEIARAHIFVRSKLSEGPWQTDSEAERCAEEIVAGVLGRTAGQEWRGISTAKFDGNAVWLLVDGQPYLGYGEAADWLCKEDRWFVKASFRRRSSDKRSDEIYCVHGVDVAPTHWMPLPAPPVAEPKVK